MDGDGVPLPLDHFFFCFLPPVAAVGACHILVSSDVLALKLTVWDSPFCRMERMVQRRAVPRSRSSAKMKWGVTEMSPKPLIG